MATKFDAVAASELRDTQGEILDVKGADISELLAGRGIVNDNHSNKLPDVVGRITGAKKIFGLEDCETDRQKYYWNKIKAPYIYTEGLLYDDEDHRSAKAAAAIIKHQFKTDSPLKLKCSVEGGILERGQKDQRVLKRTKIRGLALTLTPANNATLVEGLDLVKSAVTVEELELIKSYAPYAIQDVPSFIDFSQKVSIAKIRHNVEQIHEMVEGLKKNISLVDRLDKARPFPTADTSYYSIGSKLPQFTDKDAQHAQKDIIKELVNSEHLNGKAYKNMLNPSTGKQEPHIMVHRGISTTPDKEGGFNKLLIHDNHIEQPTNAVHTLSPHVAHGYANKEKGGGVVSFWVPISQVNSMGRYFIAGAKNRQAVSNKMFEGQTSSHYDEKTNEFYEKPIHPDEERESYAKNPQVKSEQHISIKPGKYQRASAQDLNDLEETRKNAVNRIDKKDPKMDWFFRNYNRSILNPHGDGHSFLLPNKELTKNISLAEPLEKASKKQLLQQLGSDPQSAEIADWLSKDVKRDDVQQWFLRGYKKDPKIWNTQNKEAVQHYVGTAGTNPDHDIGRIRFDKSHSFEDGMKLWKDAEDSLKNKKKDATNLVKPDNKTKKLIDLGNGWGWYDLGKGYDEAEGKAMAHCGNVNAQRAEGYPNHPHHHDRILSLRKEHKIDGETYHEPRLSFIENQGYLGETKGFGNSKPAAKYHDAITELLKHPRIKENVGGGYAPNNNFYLNDLPKDKLDKLLKDKPNIENLWKLSSGEVDPDEYPQKHYDEAELHNRALWDLDNGEENIDQARFRDIDPKYAKDLISKRISRNDDPGDHRGEVLSIMQSPHLDKSHIDQAFNENPNALMPLLSSHAANKEHVARALSHDDPDVRFVAVRSPHFGPQHMEKALSHDDPNVRQYAVRSPHYQTYLKQKGLNKAFNPSIALKKGAAENLHPQTSIPDGVHDVEVHPLVDHLKRVKGIIGDKPSMRVGELSKVVTPDIMKHVPRDAKGNVTPQAIDNHIESLPKFKVRAAVAPYTWGSQLHHPDAQENVVSVHIHPDTWEKMDDATKNHFQTLEPNQHDFKSAPRQMGWARIDQNSGLPGHMHIDEIQSDFVNRDKIKSKSQLNDQEAQDMHEFLSHGHNDPQHLIHSVVNELGRRHGFNSVSMDTPEDQARQSNLETEARLSSGDYDSGISDLERDNYNYILEHPDFIEANKKHYDRHLNSDAINFMRQNAANPYLRSALEKIPQDDIDKMKESSTLVDSMPLSDGVEFSDFASYNKLSDPEKDAFHEFLGDIDESEDRPDYRDYQHLVPPEWLEHIRALEQERDRALEQEEKPEAPELPVHQIDTYNKRPKKLGFTNVAKDSLMPNHSKPNQDVQYSKLHKIAKALTAGYGGAGSPTNLTGGGVLQAETLDQGRSFRYIDCPNCGKDQVYMKHQVKCRSCGKSFPFDTLAKFFLSK